MLSKQKFVAPAAINRTKSGLKTLIQTIAATLSTWKHSSNHPTNLLFFIEFRSMPNIKTIREPHSETISEPTKKEPVQKTVDFAHEKVNIGNRKIWKQNSHPRGLARHSFASLQDSQRAYTLSRDPSRESFASYSGNSYFFFLMQHLLCLKLAKYNYQRANGTKLRSLPKSEFSK